MNKSFIRIFFFVILVAAFSIMHCTENPFGGDEKVDLGGTRISGVISVLGGMPSEGVYVWLETYNISTYSDKNGDFELVINQSPINSGDGVLKLYFYAANYMIDFAEVVLKEGKFVYGQEDINDKGELIKDISLVPLLNMEVNVEPDELIVMEAAVEVHMSFTVMSETITIFYPLDYSGYAAPLFFKDVNSDNCYIIETLVPDVRPQSVGTLTLAQSTKVERLHYVSNHNVSFIPEGYYHVIPYVLIERTDIPAQLIQSLGDEVESFGLPYLSMPFLIDSNTLRIRTD